jgi:trimeric autotransporter adhesin
MMRLRKIKKTAAIALPIAALWVISTSHSASAQLFGLGSIGNLFSPSGGSFSFSNLSSLFSNATNGSGSNSSTGSSGIGGTLGSLLSGLGASSNSLSSLGSGSGWSNLGNITSTLGNIAPVLQSSQGNPNGLSPSTVQTVQTVGSYSQSIFGSISSNNWGGAANGIAGLLGALGVLNPQAAANVASGTSQTTGGNTTGGGSTGGTVATLAQQILNAKTPKEVYELSRQGQSSIRQGVNNISQLVLSDDGQNFLQSQKQESALALEASGQAVDAQAQNVKDSATKADDAASLTDSAAGAADTCSKAKESLACLKQISAQNAILSSGLTILTGQAALHNVGTSLLSGQLKALSAIEKINGDRLEALEVQSATQTMQQAEISTILDREHVYKLNEDKGIVATSDRTFSQTLFPGFAP